MLDQYYISQTQLARRWNCHKQQIHRLVKLGYLPTVVVAGRVVIPEALLPAERPRPKRGPKTAKV